METYVEAICYLSDIDLIYDQLKNEYKIIVTKPIIEAIYNKNKRDLVNTIFEILYKN
jgi:hypothetical protein